MKTEIQEVQDGILHWISTRSTVSLVEWIGKGRTSNTATGIGSHRVTNPDRSADWTQPHPRSGVGLEGCPYSKTNQQKTARIMKYPDRFLFSTTLFDLLLAYPLTLLLIGSPLLCDDAQ